MTAALILFTLLWVISCWTIYKLLLKKLEQAEKANEEANRYNQQAMDLYCDAIKANRAALQNWIRSEKKLQQIQNSLNCPN